MIASKYTVQSNLAVKALPSVAGTLRDKAAQRRLALG